MNSTRSFICAVIVLVLAPILVLLLKQFKATHDPIFAKEVTIVSIAMCIFAIAGTVLAIIGRKESQSMRKIIAMIVNFGYVAVMIFSGLFAVSKNVFN